MKYNCKKIFIGMLASAVMLSNITLPDSKAASANSGNGGTSGSGSFEGTLTDVFNVVVPTLPNAVNQGQQYKSPYDFILDPKGMAQNNSLKDKTLEPGATMYFENIEAGSPYDYSSTSDALEIINKSTMDVDVKLSAVLTGMGGIKLAGDKSFPYDTSTSAYFALIDGKGKTSVVDKYGAAIKTTLKAQMDAYKVIWDKAANKYRYELKSPDVLQANNIKFDTYAFRLTGCCNPANPWNKIAGEVNALVTVTWSVSPRPKNLAPSVEKTDYAMNKGCAVMVGVDLGMGEQAATGIQKITYKNSSGITTTLSENYYTFTEGILRFRPSYLNTLIDGGISSREYTVIFNNRIETPVSITLTTEDAPPAVDELSYNMVKDQPVFVNVDLGSGSLAATNIKSITYPNSSNVITTLPVERYTFENGVLRIRPSYINDLLNAGITSRVYTITFNDKNATSVVITLSIDGTTPVIDKVDYILERDKTVEVEVNLGDKGLAATGIKSVAYKNSAGVMRSIPEHYTFADGKLVIKESYVNMLIDAGLVSRDYVITFDNAVGTQRTINLSVAPKRPAIDISTGGEYSMSQNQPILVNVDLGAGSERATGIESITYLNSSGVRTTLSTNYYTFENGVLRFRPSYINGVLSAGITTRSYTITLNDAAKTQETITFKASGNAPSIVGTDTYTVAQDTAVLITVDLGTEAYKASGIKSITYVNSTGVVTTFMVKNYTFENGVLRIRPSFINTLVNGNLPSREYTIIFDNPMKTEAKFTLSK